eukprot:2884136-Amphidinium_carterae.1
MKLQCAMAPSLMELNPHQPLPRAGASRSPSPDAHKTTWTGSDLHRSAAWPGDPRGEYSMGGGGQTRLLAPASGSADPSSMWPGARNAPTKRSAQVRGETAFRDVLGRPA